MRVICCCNFALWVPFLLVWSLMLLHNGTCAWSPSSAMGNKPPVRRTQQASATSTSAPVSTPSTSSLGSINNDSESIQREIEQLRHEAELRLEKLAAEMKEFELQVVDDQPEQLILKGEVPTTTSLRNSAVSTNQEKKETIPVAKMGGTPKERIMDDWLHTEDAATEAFSSATDLRKTLESNAEVASKPLRAEMNTVHSMELLDGTRWKIVFNIGRERGTWMPSEWAASGDRLLLHVTVDFTDEPLYEHDEFFQGVAGTKVLDVVDAWVAPRGSMGRRPLRIKLEGGYKVVKGQGPMGTNIVRLFVELEETVKLSDESDVDCPIGRVYGTCGYFPIERLVAGQKRRISVKDQLIKQHRQAVKEYEELQRQIDSDTRMVSFEKMKNMKDIMDRKKHITDLVDRVQEARQRDPDKSQLRLSRKGDVGLSKEGGVCRKINKGFSFEYHILGRMEVASIECKEDHEEYDDLVHKLHP